MLHPAYAARRISYRIYEALHPNDPWIAQGAVRFCDQSLHPPMCGVETGSGRSTAWFAKRLGALTSVEHDQGWYETVQAKLRELPNVDYRLIPLDHPAEEPTRPIYEPLPNYVAIFSKFDDDSLDIVVIDGHYRQACVLAALPKLKAGGFLLIDNSNWMSAESWGVPASWRVVHRSANVMGETSIWTKPAKAA